MIDFRAGPGAELVETRAALERLLAWTEPARSQLGIEVDLPDRNGAQRARDALAAGASIEDALPGGRRGDETDLQDRCQRA